LYIKSLDIYGFKSFADRIHMDFKPGITAIVGPNGSGKSNVADAVRWVLGEQSPKTLRGGRMQDVIFSGTQLRKALSLAEVSLAIDNSTRVLPIDNSDVTITRRVLRSGENEYFINKSQSRLKDIIDLFLDTGLGKEGYSIIGQGRIDEILSIHPGERRRVFEQAAGIGKYKSRKEEAEGKLQKTRENITRIEDIAYELEQQLTLLKTHSDRAHRYIGLKHELKIIEINRFLSIYSKSVEKREKLRFDFKLQAEDRERQVSKLMSDELAVKELKAKLNSITGEIEKHKEDRHEKNRTLERLKGEIALILDKQNRILEENDLLANDIAKDEEFLYERQTSVNKANELLDSKKQLNETKKAILTDLEQNLKHLVNRSLKDINNALNNKLMITELSNEIAKLNASIAKHDTICKGFTNSIDELNNRLNAGIKSYDASVEDINGLDVEIAAKTAELHNLMTKRNTTESDLGSYNRDFNKLELSINNLKQRIESKKSRLDILESMHANYEGFSLGVKNILKAKNQSKLNGFRVCGVVADLIEVPREFRTAIEASLGSSMQHVITENEEDAKGIIEFLRANEFGRATFLPISSVKSKSLSKEESEAMYLEGTVGVASSIVRFDEEYRCIFENLLGRTIITETIEQAIRLARIYKYSFKIVTLKADVLNTGGSITGGESVRKSTATIGRKQEIDELKLELHALLETLNQEKNSLGNLNNDLNYLKTDIKNATDMMRKSEINVAILRQKLASSILQNEKIRDEIEALKIEIILAETNFKDSLSIFQNLKEDLAKKEITKQEIQAEFLKTEVEIDSLSKEKANLEKQISSVKSENLSYEHEAINLTERISFLTVDSERYLMINEKRRKKIHENLVIKADLETREISRKLEAEELSKLIEEMNSAVSQKEQDKSILGGQLLSRESSVEESRRCISQIDDLQHKIELKISKIAADLEYLDNNIWNKYNVSYGNALEYLDKLMEPESIEEKILSLSMQIEQLGEVSLNSIEDCKKLKIRYDSLIEQKEDLLEAERNLNRVIDEVTLSMRKEFCIEFEIIKGYFDTVFSKLFGGGKAQLILEDETRPLDCGIEIAAQPPGKKLQSISLLSGGEKALTALAILFAILKRKPALFCVLDEVDAVLDESNLNNLGEFLREFSLNSQFIVITHRKATMEICDMLYGIVMEERGISKLVSVKLEGIAV